MDFKYLMGKLEEAKLFFEPEAEKTVFSIGGRGHYENPISDVLAFFLDPQEVHGFEMLFINSFFSSLKLDDAPQSLDLVNPPQREVFTENGKRIDLVLEGEEWVLVVENKIYHNQCNPFEDYENYIRVNYKEKVPIFVILSPDGESVSSKWKPLSYKNLINRIKINIGITLIESTYNKWIVFLRDFIITLEQYAVRQGMNSDAISFIESNYQDVYDLVKLRESYIKHIQEAGLSKLKSLFPDQEFTTTIHNWSHGPAIRYYSNVWDGESNLVIQLSHRNSDRGIGIYFYAYNISESDIIAADQSLLKDYHKKPRIESKTIRRYESDKRYRHFNEVLPEFEETACDFNDFHATQKSGIN